MRVPRSSSVPNHSCLLDTDSCLLELTECPPIDRHPTEASCIRELRNGSLSTLTREGDSIQESGDRRKCASRAHPPSRTTPVSSS